MAKKTNGFSAKGTLDYENGQITEYNRKGEITGVIDILEELRKLDGLDNVSINIRCEQDIGLSR